MAEQPPAQPFFMLLSMKRLKSEGKIWRIGDTNQCLYTIDGRHITSTHKGIYIVKKSDGTVSKILK